MSNEGHHEAARELRLPALRLRPLREGDEAAFLEARAVMTAEDFDFGFGYEAGVAWGDYLRLVAERSRGLDLPPGLVPDTFLVADVGGTIVGRISVRHELNEMLRREGGHIGYCVLPGFRRRGYATEILRQGLVIARSVGIDRVLVTVDDDNTGSIAVIESCGGQLEDVVLLDPARPPRRRYWID